MKKSSNTANKPDDALVFPDSAPPDRRPPVSLAEITASSERLLPRRRRGRKPSEAHRFTPFVL